VLADRIGREVDDAAISGASTKSFIDLGALDEVLARTVAGDVLLIAFGHNDNKPDADRFSDPYTQFPSNLRRFIVGARSRGATPVLVTPIERRRFVDGRQRGTHEGFPQQTRNIAAEDGVALIDLQVATWSLLQKLGEEGSKAVFLHLAPGVWPGFPDGEADDTHLSREGAGLVADLVAVRLGELGIVN
jgi:lysophospholipase L1-like esterase